MTRSLLRKPFRHVAAGALSLSLIGGPLLAAAGDADRDVLERRDAPADGRVQISNIAGEVTVSGWAEAAVEVTGTLGRGIERLDISRDGPLTVIEVIYPDSSRSRDQAMLHVRVPEASELEVRTVSARIEVDGVGGRQRLVTVSGEVTSALHANGVEAETVSGDLRILGSGQSSQSTLRSVSGSIVTEHLSGDLDASSISGGIEARTALLERARLHSTSGDIELAGGLAPDGRLELSTTSGDVDVKLDHDRDLDVDAQSFSGDIDNCFGMETSRSRYSSERSLRFRVGEANRTLRIRSMSGSIDICSERRSG